jgi:hypothetical protein
LGKQIAVQISKATDEGPGTLRQVSGREVCRGGVDTNTITFSKLFTQGKANPAAVNRRNVQALFRKINRSMASPRCYI